jgi:hypothetical protein
LSEMIRPALAWEKNPQLLFATMRYRLPRQSRRHLTIFAPNGDNGESEGCIHQRIHPGMASISAPRWGADHFTYSRVPSGTLRFHREPRWGKDK